MLVKFEQNRMVLEGGGILEKQTNKQKVAFTVVSIDYKKTLI